MRCQKVEEHRWLENSELVCPVYLLRTEMRLGESQVAHVSFLSQQVDRGFVDALDSLQGLFHSAGTGGTGHARHFQGQLVTVALHLALTDQLGLKTCVCDCFFQSSLHTP